MRRVMAQGSLVDALVTRSSRRGETRLEGIRALVDWGPIVAVLAPLGAAKPGRPPYPPEVMLRALLLAQWYDLSDPGLEEALADRLSFRRFVGLSLQDPVPDETTLCRFRNALAAHNLTETVFNEVNRQLDAKGLIVKRGTLIDATVVAAAVRPPPAGEKTSPHDADANWLSHGKGQGKFGYKAHVAADEGSGLVRKAVMTPAAIHDSTPADHLIMGDEGAVYADKAYEKQARRAALRARGIKDRIMHKGQRGHKLTVWQKRHNKLLAPIRCAIERIFGTWKRSYGYRRVKYRGLRRNENQLHLLCIAFNLRKAFTLMA
jgi:IS5 family transposase